MYKQRRYLRSIALCGAATLLAACGGGGSSASTAPVASETTLDSAAWLTKCVDAPRADLGVEAQFKVCADSGLAPATDGFSFANWGGAPTTDAFTASLAVAIFGKEAVCMDTANGCVEFPAAKQWIDEMNVAIAGGRCEGMAVLSQRVFTGGETAAMMQDGAKVTAELMKDQLPVGESIARWWVSQTFPEVSSVTAKSRVLSPSSIAEKVAEALRNHAGPTLGIYANGGGHAVTPIAVLTDGGNNVRIATYDNNYPDTITHIDIDKTAESWSYSMAAVNAGASAKVWSGGTGTMDLTLMAHRAVKPTAPWANPTKVQTKSNAHNTEVLITTGGVSKAAVLVHVGNHTVDSRDLSSQIPGVTIQPFLGGNFGTGAIVDIEPTVGDVKIEPVIGEILDSAATEVPFVLGIEGPDQSAFELKGTKKIDELDIPLPTEDLSGIDGEFSLKVHGSGEFTIDEAFGEEEDLVDMHGSEEFDFIEHSDGTAEVDLLDESGKLVWQDIETGIDEDGVFDKVEVSYDETTHHIVEHDYIDKVEVLDEKVIAEFENDIETIAPQSVSKSSTSIGGSPSDTGEVPMGKSEDTVVG